MSNEDKLQAGRYTLGSKLTQRLPLIVFLVAVLGALIPVVRNWDLAFPNQKVKYDTIEHSEDTFHAKESTIIQLKNSVDKLEQSTENLNKVLTKFVEEQTEVNRAIGLDLQQIKNKD